MKSLNKLKENIYGRILSFKKANTIGQIKFEKRELQRALHAEEREGASRMIW